jgi:hypothetical protein
MVSLSITLMAVGRSKLDCSMRVGVTTIGASRTSLFSSADAPQEARAKMATAVGFNAGLNKKLRTVPLPKNLFDLY